MPTPEHPPRIPVTSVSSFVSNEVLASQINLLQNSVDALVSTVNDLPNERTLRALLEIRDARIDSLTADVKAITEALRSEQSAREQGDKRIREESESAKRFAVTTSLAMVTVMLGILTIGMKFVIGG